MFGIVVNVESTWQTAHLSERAWYTQLCDPAYIGGRCKLLPPLRRAGSVHNRLGSVMVE